MTEEYIASGLMLNTITNNYVAGIKYAPINIQDIQDQNQDKVIAYYKNNYEAQYLFDCNTTFVTVNTELKFCAFVMDTNTHRKDDIVKQDISEYFNMVNIPVTISTIINNKENTDPNLVPIFEDDITTEDIDESILQIYNISSLNDPIYKLRSSTFSIVDKNDNVYDVYYKIGFCPSDGTEVSEDDIINNLKYCSLLFEDNYITLETTPWNYKLLTFVNQYNDSISFNTDSIALWTPLYIKNTNTYIGILYAQMYDSKTGNKITSQIKPVDAIIKSDYTSDIYVEYNNFYAPIKDYYINKGYIPSKIYTL